MKTSVTWLPESEIIDKLRDRPRLEGIPHYYSTLLGGWTDSSLGGLVGLDDHGFHRGDGVFEALRGVNHRPYLFHEHFLRLQKSAEWIGLGLPLGEEEVREVLMQGLARFPESDSLIRIFVTRGPGGFSTSPAESKGAQLFMVIMKFRPVAEALYSSGVRIGRSGIPVKAGFLPRVKSLNYLPNVLMKAESLARGLDFTVSFDEQGFLAESSTENIVVVGAESGGAPQILIPSLDRILKGCTMTRLAQLIREKTNYSLVEGCRLTEGDLRVAHGAMMVGTTLDVLPVREYEGHALPVSAIAQELRILIQQDQQ